MESIIVERAHKSKAFLLIGAIGLSVGCVLFGITFYQFYGFAAVVHVLSTAGGLNGAVLKGGYIHYSVLMLLSIVMVVLGFLLVYRNFEGRTKKKAHVR